MSKSRGKKSKVPKISEEEYAKYINALKNGTREAAMSAETAASEEEKQSPQNG